MVSTDVGAGAGRKRLRLGGLLEGFGGAAAGGVGVGGAGDGGAASGGAGGGGTTTGGERASSTVTGSGGCGLGVSPRVDSRASSTSTWPSTLTAAISGWKRFADWRRACAKAFRGMVTP